MDSCVVKRWTVDGVELSKIIGENIGMEFYEVFDVLRDFHPESARDSAYVDLSESGLKEDLSSGWTEDGQFILENVHPISLTERVIVELLHLIDEVKIPDNFILLLDW